MKNKVTKLASLLLSLVMMITCVLPLSVEAANYRDFSVGDTLRIETPSGINMHIMPSTGTRVIRAFATGTRLNVLSIDSSTGWMKVSTTDNRYTGFMLGSEGWFSLYNTDPLPTVYPYKNMKAVVKPSRLNVYTTPVARDAYIAGVLGKNNEVNALGYTSNGWTQISYQNKTLYVQSAQVTIMPRSQSTTASQTEKFTKIYGYSAQVNSGISGLNMRRDANVKSDIITELHDGQVVTILAQSANWFKVTLNVDNEMETGYISRSYAKRIDALGNLRLSASTKTLKKGKKYHILIRGTTGMSVKATWKTSNKNVASVTKTGYVTAKKAGSAVITCTLNVGSRKKVLKCTIKVTK